MSLTVNTNLSSITAVNNLNVSQGKLSGVFNRISSGLRINQAADDAAGLAVAENLDAVNRSLDAATRNANDGISVIQTAEGASKEVTELLKRMRELAVQSSSETLDSAERQYIQTEVTSIEDEIGRIAEVTNFNGVLLTEGTNTALDVQVGVDNSANDRITITLGDLSVATLGVNAMDVDDVTAAQAAIDTIDSAIDTVNGFRAEFGAVQNRLSSAIQNLSTYSENVSAAKSRIMDADFAKEAADLSRFQIMQQAGTAILGQANQVSQGALQLIG